jgi:hypothetical protein
MAPASLRERKGLVHEDRLNAATGLSRSTAQLSLTYSLGMRIGGGVPRSQSPALIRVLEPSTQTAGTAMRRSATRQLPGLSPNKSLEFPMRTLQLQ